MSDDDGILLSRVAANIYWMMRYLERAENVTRLVDVNNNLTLDLPSGLKCQWTPLIQTTASTELYEKKYKEAEAHDVISFMTFDDDNPNSIISCVRAARENARRVRESISSEMWAVLNGLYLELLNLQQRADAVVDDPSAVFDTIRTQCQAFHGVMASTLSRGTAWNFASLAMHLERADKTSRILDVKYFYLLPEPAHVGSPLDTIQWSALLNSAGALEMYRYRHGMISPERIAEFLLLDRNFPRSVLYCLFAAERELQAITGAGSNAWQVTPEKQLGLLNAQLRFAAIEEVIDGGMHEFLDDIQKRLNAIDDGIQDHYFSIATAAVSSV